MGILGYKPTDPEDPKTKRKTPKPRVGTKRENRAIVFSPHFAPLFLCDDEQPRKRETGTIITVGTAAAAKKKKKSICFCGRKERKRGRPRLRKGSRRGWSNPPLLAPQRRLFGNFLSSWHYSEWEIDRQGARQQ